MPPTLSRWLPARRHHDPPIKHSQRPRGDGLTRTSLTGCTTPSRCLPATLSASPTTASAGSSVTLSSAAAKCSLGYTSGHTYSITLTNKGVAGKPVTATVARDGAFSTEIPIPADFSHGTAYLIVTGSPYDNCENGQSCAGYSTTIIVE